MDYEDTNREIDQRRVLPVPFVVLLDLDRCLLDTNAFVAAFYAVLDPAVAASLKGAQAKVEASAGSFDLAGEIKSRVDEGEWRRIRCRFMEANEGKDYLNDGAVDLIERLRAHKVPLAIMTYGGEEWQRLKQRKARLEHIPMIVVDRKEKGQIIGSWMNSDGQFVIPIGEGAQSLLALRVILVDDKIEAFVDAPEQMDGICVHKQSDSRLETVSPTVESVESFDSVGQVIDRLLQQDVSGLLRHDIDKKA